MQARASHAGSTTARTPELAEHIDDIIRSGTQNQHKALIETLVAQI